MENFFIIGFVKKSILDKKFCIVQ
ncbi:unnamed protein product, partial [Psylliodes chrysocephalus]